MEDTKASAPPGHPVARPLRRWSIAINVALQLTLLITLFGLANYLSYRHYLRRDLTPSHDYTLSDTTLNYMRKLAKDVDIAVVFSRESGIMPDIRTLADDYRRSNAKGHIHVEEIDPARDLQRAEELKLQSDVLFKTNGILVRANGRSRFLPEDEIVIKVPSGDRQHPNVEFRGEDAVTSAIIALLEGKTKKFYFVVGKGDAVGKGLEQAYETLTALGKQQNFEVESLDPAGKIDKIPEDAGGLLIVGPKYDFTDREMAMITAYWHGKHAAILVLLDPNGETPRLHDFLGSNGVFPRADRVLFAESTSTGPKKEFNVETIFRNDSPISRPFVETASTFSGQTQSLDLRTGSPELNAQNIDVVPLAVAAPQYWGETHYLEPLPVIGPEDTGPPVYLAASVERGHVSDVRLESSRMVVVGNATLLDPAIHLAVQQDFIAASLNWMINRERLIGITPKQKHMFRVELTKAQQKKTFWVTAVLMPGVVLMLGVLVWNHRRV